MAGVETQPEVFSNRDTGGTFITIQHVGRGGDAGAGKWPTPERRAVVAGLERAPGFGLQAQHHRAA